MVANDPAGDTIFDPTLGPRGPIYSVLWHVGEHQRRHVLSHRISCRPRHPPTASLAMPRPPDRPWLSTSIMDFWRFR